MISPNAKRNWKAIKSFLGRCHAGLADCHQHFRRSTSVFFLLPKIQYYIQYMRKSEIITHIFHVMTDGQNLFNISIFLLDCNTIKERDKLSL